MNQEVENKNLENSKKRLKVYYSLLVSVLCFIGVSFAFFQLFLRQTDNNGISALNCFSSTLTEETSAINLSNKFPIKNEDGIKKTPFTFKITNNCNNYVKAYITIDPLKEGTSNYILSKYMKANVSTKGTTDGTSLIIGTQNTKVLDNKHNGYIVKEVGLNKNESKEFDLRLWIDYDTTKEQAAGMTYLSQVVIVTEPGKQTLSEAILTNNEVKTPLTTPGKEISAHTKDDITTTQTVSVSSAEQAYYVTYGTGWTANGTKFNLTGTAVTSDTYVNSYSDLVGKYLPSGLYYSGSSAAGDMKTTINLSKVYYVVSATSSSYTYKIITSNKNVSEALLASTEDDYGTSYYFRGNVKNNYVEFANKCWRIVRIAGDNSVKLVLHNDNTGGVSDPCSSANNSTSAAFARFSGTTYESEFNSSDDDNAYIGFMYGTAGSNDYANTHANINKSIILTNLEIWYNNNLSSYDSKIVSTVWCNDKTNVTGLGYGTNKTYYGADQRLASASGNAGGTGPSLKCNGEFSKVASKIALMTADELAFVGYAENIGNTIVYLQENSSSSVNWWSLSPLFFNGDYALVWVVGGYDGYLYGRNVEYSSDIRPSISLVSNITISGGSGTSEDPYVIN